MIYFKDERYVLTQNEGEVVVLDTDNEVTDENLELFSVDFVDEEDAIYIANELYSLVRSLNEKHKDLKDK